MPLECKDTTTLSEPAGQALGLLEAHVSLSSQRLNICEFPGRSRGGRWPSMSTCKPHGSRTASMAWVGHVTPRKREPHPQEGQETPKGQPHPGRSLGLNSSPWSGRV